jgi:Tol biopolymer transport system component
MVWVVTDRAIPDWLAGHLAACDQGRADRTPVLDNVAMMLRPLGMILAVAAIGCSSTDPPTPIPIQIEDRAPSWSPDSQSVAYVHFNPDPSDTVEPNGLYVVDVQTSAKQVVLRGYPRSVDWSPDSQWLVFNDPSGIHVVSRLGDSLRTINPGGSFPNWSPNGGYIAFDANAKIWQVNTDGTLLEEVPLPTNLGARDPDWSPDGTRLVVLLFLQGATGEEVFIVATDGSYSRRLTADSNEDRSPAWAPTGASVVWNRWLKDPNGRTRPQIWIMDTLGTQLQFVAAAEAAPAWDPTGSYIVFSAQATGAIRLFTARSDGTDVKQLTW